ncbi:MAG TPA: hypothetical protein VK085_08470 [Pseudogracilibacillus sp.]|nr:hypothetical protein [Pseudogracilibacillus sp.]
MRKLWIFSLYFVFIWIVKLLTALIDQPMSAAVVKSSFLGAAILFSVFLFSKFIFDKPKTRGNK